MNRDIQHNVSVLRLIVDFAECDLCWVSHISLLCWVSLYWTSLCWVSWRRLASQKVSIGSYCLVKWSKTTLSLSTFYKIVRVLKTRKFPNMELKMILSKVGFLSRCLNLGNDCKMCGRPWTQQQLHEHFSKPFK
jgi:hypothetical protein